MMARKVKCYFERGGNALIIEGELKVRGDGKLYIGDVEITSEGLGSITIADGTITKTKLAQAVQDTLGLADSALQAIAAGSVGTTELDVATNASLGLADSALQAVPDGSVTSTKCDAGVQTSLGKADTALQSIAAGSVGSTELDVATNASLGLADTALQAIPSGGVGTTELDAGVNASLELADTALQNVQLEELQAVNAVASTGKLTVSGTADDGEKVNIGEETYELDTDASVTGGNITVDISGGTKGQATGSMTFVGAALEGDYFSIGDETYEIDYDGSVTAGRTAIDVSGAASAAAAGSVFTLTDDVADGQTVTLRGKVYEFDTDNSVTGGNIKVNVAGALDKQSACVALATAIETEDGDYFDASATLSGADWIVTVTALVKGTGPNAYAVDETCANGSWAGAGFLTGGVDAPADEAITIICSTFDSETAYGIEATDEEGDVISFTADVAGAQDGSVGNGIATVASGMTNASFGAGYLAGGYDCTEAEAGAAILAQIIASSALVDATDGGSNDVSLAAKIKGVAGDLITTTTDMANGAFGAGALSGGVDGTVGSKGDILFNANSIYICIADNTIADANWKSAALS